MCIRHFLTAAAITAAAACGARDDAAGGSQTPNAPQTEEAASSQGLSIAVSIPETASTAPTDGRLILILGSDGDKEPRLQTSWRFDAPQIFGRDVEQAGPGAVIELSTDWTGFPRDASEALPPGDYAVQAVLHRYDDFSRANGPPVSLPASWAAGQNWRLEPGNLFSKPQLLTIDDAGRGDLNIVLDQINPPIEPPADTRYIRHIEITSERLSEFWGRPMTLGAHVLVPEGFDDNPDARYPLMIFHGHYPADFGGFRTEPPDEEAACEYSARFDLDCYNQIQDREAYAFYQQWIAPDFPRVLIIEIQHANPFYDDSYAVNSANLGPYGDAITYELIPYIEEQFRGSGAPWARVLYGGSTGGWEAMAAQVFYPEEYNGAYAACPDPIDFRAYGLVNIYEDRNAYFQEGPFTRLARPAHRDYLGRVSATLEMMNHYEAALGSKSRSGDQWDIWEAVYSPMGADGYPQPLWDKRTGAIDAEVAAYWRQNYDLSAILERDWATLGPKLRGKINIYTGDMDNYYLNNAVYLAEDFLRRADPPFEGEIDYGDRAEHCWNGDHDNSNAISRLRYNTFYMPKILERIEATAPAGADLTSWRY